VFTIPLEEADGGDDDDPTKGEHEMEQGEAEEGKLFIRN